MGRSPRAASRYLNNPWKVPFSNKLCSERPAAYNAIYTVPKNPDYVRYYRPMVMVHGTESIDGRIPEGLRAAVRAAQAKPPRVATKTGLLLVNDPKRSELRIDVSRRSSQVEGRQQLVCAVLRGDRIFTAVRSGENAIKTLSARYRSRATKFEFVTIDGE